MLLTHHCFATFRAVKPYVGAFTLSAVALLSTAQARSLTEIRQSGTLLVGTGGDLPPFTFMAGGKNVGLEVELIERLAADLNLKVQYVAVSNDNSIRALQDGQADVIVNAMGVTSTRETKIDFSQPYLCAGMSVVSRDPKIQTRFDLEGKTVGVPSGTTVQAYLQKLPFQKRVNVYPTPGDVAVALASGQIDATLAYSAMEPIFSKMYSKAGLSFGPEQWSIPVGLMLPGGSGALRLLIDADLAKLRRTGEIDKLMNKYFAGFNMHCH